MLYLGVGGGTITPCMLLPRDLPVDMKAKYMILMIVIMCSPRLR